MRQNQEGASVVLRQTKPFFLSKLDGVGRIRQTINTFQAPEQDGAFYISSTLDMRNITIEGSAVISISTNNEHVAICTQVGQVVKIHALTGQVVWDEFTPDPLIMNVISDFGNVYVLTAANSPRHFYKLSSDDGSILWSVNNHSVATHPASISSDFVVGADENLHYCHFSRGIAPTTGGGFSGARAVYVVLNPEGTSISSGNVSGMTSHTNSGSGSIVGLALDEQNRLFYHTPFRDLEAQLELIIVDLLEHFASITNQRQRKDGLR